MNQEMEGVSCLSVPVHHPLGECFLSVPQLWSLQVLMSWATKGKILLPRDKRDPFNLQLPQGCFGHLTSKDK